MNNMEEIRKMLAGVGVTVEEALKNFDANMKALNRLASPEPQLIQGYTAEQWQEVIDGGYLCEGYAQNNIWVPVTLKDVSTAKASQFMGNDGYHYSICRPAQIKGVMRPIFAAPVDKEARVILVKGNNEVFSELSWGMFKDLTLPEINMPTKYIEL